MINEKFWLAVAFLSFVALIVKYVGPIIAKSLDDKSKKIAEEILAAKELKGKVAKLLSSAEKYYEESVFFSQKLIRDTETESKKIVAEAKQLLELEVSKKTAASLQRIQLEEEMAIREIKAKIVSSALKNLNESFEKNLDQAPQAALAEQSLQDFTKIIH